MTTAKTGRDYDPYEIAQSIAGQFAQLDVVEVVWLGGSQATGRANARSDIDLYVYSRETLPVKARAAVVGPRASEMQLDNPFWEVEDFWYE